MGTIIDSTVGPAKTCSVALSSSSVTYPSSVTAKVIGNNNSLTTNPAPTPPGDTVGLWVVKSDGQPIVPLPNPTPPGVTPVVYPPSPTPGSINYYKLSGCLSNDKSCTTQTTVSLPVGDYYFLCDQQRLPKCSGNPFCPSSEINRAGVDCTAWAQCSLGDPYEPFGDDAVHFVVNPPPTPTPTPGGPTVTPAPTPTQTPTNNCSTLGALNPIRLDPSVTSLLSLSDNTEAGLFSTSGFCLIDPRAKIPSFSLPTYADLKSIYFNQNKSDQVSRITLAGDQTGADINSVLTNSSLTNYCTKNTCLINVGGNLTITESSLAVQIDKPTVIFVNGYLRLDPNNGRFDYSHGKNNAGVVFVVGGDIFIGKDVGDSNPGHGNDKTIDAFFITSGQFCSAANNTTCLSTSTTTLQLIINGSIISLDPTKPPQFVRVNQVNIQPSETIVYDPKYLVILKSIFAKDLPIWSEVQ